MTRKGGSPTLILFVREPMMSARNDKGSSIEPPQESFWDVAGHLLHIGDAVDQLSLLFATEESRWSVDACSIVSSREKRWSASEPIADLCRAVNSRCSGMVSCLSYGVGVGSVRGCTLLP